MSKFSNNKQNTVLQRFWDWPAVLLLLASLLTTAQRLVATKWTDDLGMVITITILGVISGLVFGYSRLKGWLVMLSGMVYGTFFIGWHYGRSLGRGVLWQERLLSLAGRLSLSFDLLAARQEVPDPLLFHLSMGILFWLLSFAAGFSLMRRANPWLAIIPAGIAQVLIHTYDPYYRIRMWPLAFFLLFGLGLVARLHYLRQRATWKMENVRTPFYTGPDMMRITLVAAAVLVLLAWTAPALVSSLEPAETFWRQLTEPWRGVREQIQRAFYSLRSSTSDSIDHYGASLPLGRGNPLGDKTVLNIETQGRRPATARYYWRARVYDYFDPFDQGWQSTIADSTEVSPGRFILNLPADAGSWEADFTVYPQSSLTVLYTASQPIWVSRPAQIWYAAAPDGFMDISYIRMDSMLRPGERYDFRALITDVSVNQLRLAGDDYPDGVKERYLQLPGSTTQRTLDLAQQLAAGQITPYDISQTITEYLRDEIEWVETMPPLPEEQDPIDWMLFDIKQGFCNYSATAEIVMLRSLGIPARLGVGYAQGEATLNEEQLEELEREGLQPDQLNRLWQVATSYTIRQRDLHAWPEVYFPGIGWVEFEPSANQESLVRPVEIQSEVLEGAAASGLTPEQEIEGARLGQRRDANQKDDEVSDACGFLSTATTRFFALLAGSLMMLAAVAWRVLRRRGLAPFPILLEQGLRKAHLDPPAALTRWCQRSSLTAIEKAYQEINIALKTFKQPASPQATPAERAALLGKILPPLAPYASRLCLEYQNAVYGQKQEELQAALKAASEIQKMVRLVKLNRISVGLIKIRLPE